mgnify:CR=1 FL=1
MEVTTGVCKCEDECECEEELEDFTDEENF